MKLTKKCKRMIKEQYARTKEILTEKRELLDLIAKTLLEVETLDAGQIKHLKEHGTLPVRPYDVSKDETADKKEDVETTKVDEVTPDVTGAPNDPSIADLPKEETTVEPSGDIKEDRK